jgi:hypothetical protein
MATNKKSSAPFTPEDLARIKQQLAMLDEAEDIIERGIKGGIDLEEQKKTLRDQREQLVKLKNSFFPGQ